MQLVVAARSLKVVDVFGKISLIDTTESTAQDTSDNNGVGTARWFIPARKIVDPASGGKNWRRLSRHSGQQFCLHGQEKPAYFISGCGFIPSRSDNEIEQLRRFCPPERGGSFALQAIEPGGNFPDQEYLTVDRERTNFF